MSLFARVRASAPKRQSMRAHCIGMLTRARFLLGGGDSLLGGGEAGSADQGTVDDIFPAEKKEVPAHCSATLSWQAAAADACSIPETWSCRETKTYAHSHKHNRNETKQKALNA